MTVSGRITLLRNFSSHADTNPSESATLTRAYTAAERIASARAWRAAAPAMPIQCPPGDSFFVANIECPCTCSVYGLHSQKFATARCSGVSDLPTV